MDTITAYAKAKAAELTPRQAAEMLATMPASAMGSPLAEALLERVATPAPVPSADHNHAGNEADKAMGAIADAHGRAWEKYDAKGLRTCTCGRVFTTPNGLGLHLGAVDRKAWKAWDAAYTKALEAFRSGQVNA